MTLVQNVVKNPCFVHRFYTSKWGWWTRVLLVYYTWQCLKHVSNSRIFYVLKTRSQHVLELRSKHVPKHGWRWCKTSWKTRVLYTGFTRLSGVGEHVFYSFITHGNVYGVVGCLQARSQKFAMGGLFGGSGGGAPNRRRPMGVWGRSSQLPEAGGLGAKPPAAGGTGVWGRSPQRSKILHFIAKITSF